VFSGLKHHPIIISKTQVLANHAQTTDTASQDASTTEDQHTTCFAGLSTLGGGTVTIHSQLLSPFSCPYSDPISVTSPTDTSQDFPNLIGSHRLSRSYPTGTQRAHPIAPKPPSELQSVWPSINIRDVTAFQDHVVLK